MLNLHVSGTYILSPAIVSFFVSQCLRVSPTCIFFEFYICDSVFTKYPFFLRLSLLPTDFDVCPIAGVNSRGVLLTDER
jgi:hypothetical protein